ncbi:hypothetical protein ACQR3Z_28340 [Nocardia fluminea]
MIALLGMFTAADQECCASSDYRRQHDPYNSNDGYICHSVPMVEFPRTSALWRSSMPYIVARAEISIPQLNQLSEFTWVDFLLVELHERCGAAWQ